MTTSQCQECLNTPRSQPCRVRLVALWSCFGGILQYKWDIKDKDGLTNFICFEYVGYIYQHDVLVCNAKFSLHIVFGFQIFRTLFSIYLDLKSQIAIAGFFFHEFCLFIFLFIF